MRWFKRRTMPLSIPSDARNWNGWSRASGRWKAMVAIARKLLVVVWHVLTKEVADRHAVPVNVSDWPTAWVCVISRRKRVELHQTKSGQAQTWAGVDGAALGQ
jgi:hypothetical protein